MSNIYKELSKSSIMVGVEKTLSAGSDADAIFLGSDFLTAPKEDNHGNQEKGCEQMIISLLTPKVSCKS
jgi:hypothetical protein